MNQVTIDKIRLQIGDQMVELTVEQAKDLKKVLNDLWPETTITVTPAQPYQPPYIPWQPQTPDPYPWWTPPMIKYCQADNSNILCLSTK